MSDDSRHVGIEGFVLLDVGERTGPPSEPVLHVAVLGEKELALAICDYDEDHKTRTFKTRESIIVDIEPLLNGIRASLLSEGWKLR